MESTSTTQAMPLPKNLRSKQKEVIEEFKTKTTVIAKLPTGYGKTITAAGSYAMLRYLGVCNRVLYIVPRASQSDQAAESIPEDLREFFSIDTKSLQVTKNPIQALNYHKESKCEVFVCTVQALESSDSTKRTLAVLMETGKWFVVIDEHHHYGNESNWSQSIRSLNYCAMLAMSATPNRKDGSDHFPEPSIKESYQNACKSGFVKNLSLHAYDYIIDAVTVDGIAIPFTTQEIVGEAGGDSPEAIDKYLASKKMRWSPKYVSPLITYPIDRITDLRVRGIKAQMLVQAMSISHAKMVCQQIESLKPDFMSVDWVGTGPEGRPDNENAEVLKRFCPSKDKITKRREWTLDILVNVGIASEGLDSTDVCEVVFLTPANITISNLQTIGRGARVMPGLKKQPTCHVNVDTSSPMSEFLGPSVMALFDYNQDELKEIDLEKEYGGGEATESAPDTYNPLPEQMTVILVDVRLADIKKGQMWEEALKGAISVSSPDTPMELIEKGAENALMKYLNRSNNTSATLAQHRNDISAAASKVAGLCIQRLADSGVRIEKTLKGDMARRINSKKKVLFGAVDSADEDALVKQYEWLKALEKQILLDHGTKGFPAWLR
jgi:hypothetical protein